MIQRHVSPIVIDLSRQYPVLSITGPRQSGKTTLARTLFSKHQYVNFEDLETLSLARQDPKGFLNRYTSPVIFDEVQKVPELLSYIMVNVDEDPTPGRFILTGSQNFSLSQAVSQSLAGRVGNVTLLPFSIQELKKSKNLHTDYLKQIITGFYPRIYSTNMTARNLYNDYIATYIERDVRQIKQIGDLSLFQRFLQVLAGRVGQILNLSSIGNDLGISYNTIESWISVLEASYIVFRLQPFHQNYNKRIVKSPKLYFYDVGLAAYLMRIDSQTELLTHFALGSLFENMIIADFFKEIYHSRASDMVYFWRDSTGNEVDCILDTGSQKIPIEIKASSTYSSDFFKHIHYWKDLSKSQMPGYVIYTGDQEQRVHGNRLVRWDNLPLDIRV